MSAARFSSYEYRELRYYLSTATDFAVDFYLSWSSEVT